MTARGASLSVTGVGPSTARENNPGGRRCEAQQAAARGLRYRKSVWIPSHYMQLRSLHLLGHDLRFDPLAGVISVGEASVDKMA